MDALQTRQRLTAGAAVGALIAAMVSAGDPAVRGISAKLGAKVATKGPATVATDLPEKRCFDALRPMFAKSAWKITIERGIQHNATLPMETFDIDSNGQVVWKSGYMPDRRIELSPRERPLLEGIVNASCKGELEHSQAEFLNIYPAGTNRYDGDWPIEWSPARETLEMLVERLKTRYVDERRAELGTITLDVRVRDEDTRDDIARIWYRVRVADDILLVTRGSRVLVRKAVTKQEIVDLVDRLGHQPVEARASLRGALIAGGTTIPVGQDHLWGPVFGDVYDAVHCDSHPDSRYSACR